MISHFTLLSYCVTLWPIPARKHLRLWPVLVSFSAFYPAITAFSLVISILLTGPGSLLLRYQVFESTSSSSHPAFHACRHLWQHIVVKKIKVSTGSYLALLCTSSLFAGLHVRL